jgi:HEAT repeats
MALSVTCPQCGSLLNLDPALAGERVRCPHCQAVVDVPAAGRRVESGIRDESPQMKSRGESRRVAAEDDAPAGRRAADGDDPDSFRRRDVSKPLPVGWIVGGIGAGVGVVVLAIVLVLIFVREEQPPPPAVFQVQGPGMNIKMEIPQDFAKQMQEMQQQMQQGMPQNGPNVFPPIDFNPVQAEPEDPDPINRALKKLRSENASFQRNGARELENLEPVEKRRAEVIQALKKVANAPDLFAPRGEAVKAISRWGTKDEVPFFLELIDHNDHNVRQAVLVALGQWKDPRAADPVAQRLVNGQDRPWASKALKEIGPAAEKPVIEMLRHEDAGVRVEACRVLKVIGGKEGQAALVKATDDVDKGVIQAAREALPPELRPPIYGPNQLMRLNVQVRDAKAWPDIEAKLRKLADAPKAVLKVTTSGDYKWVDLSPVNCDAETFARRITFAKVGAVYNDRRLIYVDSGK